MENSQQGQQQQQQQQQQQRRKKRRLTPRQLVQRVLLVQALLFSLQLYIFHFYLAKYKDWTEHNKNKTKNIKQSKLSPNTIEALYKSQHSGRIEILRRNGTYQHPGLPQQQQKTSHPSTVKESSSSVTKSKDESLPPVLIIGGSDGSGTRAFVHALDQLGVMFIADDHGTFDIHGGSLFGKQGWPPLVRTVLRRTHSANYEYDNLPNRTQNIIQREVSKFITSLKRRSIFLESQLGKQNITDIRYGFKAPVSMLLLPIWMKFFNNNIKFLHVIRDGRDVALSSNQSPVTKFYNTTYVDHIKKSKQFTGEYEAVKAIQLWNDWNVQVHDWATSHMQKSDDDNNSKKSLDYLVMRSEDLLNPNKRFECLTKLAEFVGSTVTTDKLCCISQYGIVDFGISTSFTSSSGGKNETKNNQTTTTTTTTTTATTTTNNDNNNNSTKKNVNSTTMKGTSKETTTTTTDGRKLTTTTTTTTNNNNHKSSSTGSSIKQRYGKWIKVLENKPTLSRYLHYFGSKGLRMFGYHPHVDIVYYSNNNNKNNNKTNTNTNNTNNSSSSAIIIKKSSSSLSSSSSSCNKNKKCPRIFNTLRQFVETPTTNTKRRRMMGKEEGSH